MAERRTFLAADGRKSFLPPELKVPAAERWDSEGHKYQPQIALKTSRDAEDVLNTTLEHPKPRLLFAVWKVPACTEAWHSSDLKPPRRHF